MNRTRLVAVTASLALLIAAGLASVALGTRSIPLRDVLDALVAHDGSTDAALVREIRWPRTLIGLLAGSALGVAGAVMQAVARNPLADPGILGVTAGAALAVVLAIELLGVDALAGQVWFALAGAAVAGAAVLLFGAGPGRAAEARLVLAGVAIAGLLTSFTTAIVLSDQRTLDEFRVWVLGSLGGRDAGVAAAVAPFVAAGVALALLLAPALNALSLGDDAARSLGHRPARTRVAAAASVVLLAGAATAAAGPIAFVGLAVPNVVRLLAGPDHRFLLPYVALLAPAVLLAADVIGRIVVRPGELQVGIVTAALGAPFFVAVARRRRLVRL